MTLKSFGELTGWGETDLGKLPCPSGTDFVQISAGYDHGIALKTDGAITNWGNAIEIANPPSDTNFILVATKYLHNLAIQPPPPLQLFVTNENYTVATEISTATIGGSNNTEIVGVWYSNCLTHSTGTITVGTPWWTVSGISLNVGINEIIVFGTNAFGNSISDTVEIERLPPDTTKPFINITNETPINVTFDIDQFIISGTNVNIFGNMFWSNSLSVGEFSFSDFSVNINNLNVGDNFITVFGSNQFNYWTNDTITITRKAEPMPILFITNSTPIELKFGTTAQIIGGTNLNIFGNLSWSNSLSATAHSFSRSGNSFSRNIDNLETGDNIIAVWGTNEFGSPVFDTITITVLDEPLPILFITNSTPIELKYGTTSQTISGTNLNIFGSMTWSNSLAVGNHPFTRSGNSFSRNIDNLQIGDNFITIWGTNEFDRFTFDTIKITVLPEPLPVLFITNGSPINVNVGTTSQIIGGTNLNIFGSMTWSNSLAAGNFALARSGNSFSRNIDNLQIGDNNIVVWGTNEYDRTVSDSVIIIVPEEPMPFINITNSEPIDVAFNVGNYQISGTNINISGDMIWTNSLAVGENSFAGFPVDISDLQVGDNLIYVFGTNAFGRFTNDFITITRQAEPMPFIIITNDNPIVVNYGTTSQIIGGTIVLETLSQEILIIWKLAIILLLFGELMSSKALFSILLLLQFSKNLCLSFLLQILLQ